MDLLAAILAMLSWAPHVKHSDHCRHMHIARRLAPAVAKAAHATKMDELLIAAVAITESGGRGDKVSSKGAVGPMQTLPEGRAKRLCAKLDIRQYSSNVLCGALLLRDAQQRCGGEPAHWLSSYNNFPCGRTSYSERILATAARAGLLLACN